MIEIKANGLKEVSDALKQLPAKIQQNSLRSAVYAAAAVIRNEAKQKAPVVTGTLKRAVSITRNKKRSTGPMQAMKVIVRKGKKLRKVGKTGKNLSADAWYAHFVEFGTKRMQPKPFLRPAYEAKKESAVEAFRNSLANGIEKAKQQAVK
ncbi:HK97-gp10 family putative phage morphogenesis protein [Candidatus Magnetaquicoccus inordinatus]|uniref:HK97-gp10 family putative phage morphogenesis protein n=1 Tax=Candidatus Magnetaquicoccus inordinatus TaxID=2496818 RepID=UPI00102D2306|nr:HK97-gp10 family putative phage morphogenesis protein [Candidatus Magnetaquicoccus inordinatus]